MRFQVPQFIEVEDKIFGPLTFRQFVYLAGGAGLCFISYKFLPIFLYIFVIPAFAVFSLALAFYKVNNKPFIDVVEAAFHFYLSDRLYIWKKQEKKVKETITQLGEMPSIIIPKINESKLKELTWSLDINEGAYAKETKELQNNAKERMSKEKKNPLGLEF